MFMLDTSSSVSGVTRSHNPDLNVESVSGEWNRLNAQIPNNNGMTSCHAVIVLTSTDKSRVHFWALFYWYAQNSMSIFSDSKENFQTFPWPWRILTISWPVATMLGNYSTVQNTMRIPFYFETTGYKILYNCTVSSWTITDWWNTLNDWSLIKVLHS